MQIDKQMDSRLGSVNFEDCDLFVIMIIIEYLISIIISHLDL
jgi:hypothetical protein